MSEQLRPEVVEELVRLVERRLAEGELPAWSDDAESWAARLDWSTPAERVAAYDRALAPWRVLLAEVERQREADRASGLDDWAWCYRHGINFDRAGKPL